LISPRISVRVLASLYDTAERVVAGAQGIAAPLQVLSAGSDWVVHRGAQRRFFDRIGSAEKEWVELPGYYHEVFHEQQRAEVIARAAGFIARAFAGGPGADAVLAPADGRFDAAAFERLCRPLPLWSPWRWGYAATRFGMQTVGRLSDGVRLGWRSGFESGRSLDYVYDNQPRGRGLLGRAIDRVYLGSPGWVGIRTRGGHLRAMLSAEIGWRRQAGRKVHVLDVAGGPGRYLVDTLAQLRDPAVTAQCRDLDEDSLQQGRELAEQRGVSGLLYARADAFDAGSYQSLLPQPDVVVVSGLFELFDDNQRLLNALQAIHAALPEDGSLIVTNQPTHPQLAFIARVLDDRHGRPWVMRLRPQRELQALLRQAGFASQRRLIDDQGIFTVNLATKAAA
jgi:SAM-dependent methyltransferase